MKKPNLLVVFADQWRNTARGLHNPQIATPNMDRFAEEAFSTDQAVSGCPLCSPYRSELLTGRRAVHTGVIGNCMTGYDMCLSPDELCISQVLKESGYRTGYIGKWHLDSPELNSGSQPYQERRAGMLIRHREKNGMLLSTGMRIMHGTITCICIIEKKAAKKSSRTSGRRFMRRIKHWSSWRAGRRSLLHCSSPGIRPILLLKRYRKSIMTFTVI